MNKQQLLASVSNLEAASSCLEMNSREHDNWHQSLKHFSRDFINQLPSQKAARKSSKSNVKNIFNVGESADMNDILGIVDKYITHDCIDTASARYLGFIPGGGIPLSAFADYIAALSNRYAGNIVAAPGPVEMERAMLGWINEIVDFPETASGNLTSGGSYASMIALVTAREAFDLKPNNIEKSVIYLSDLTHHSIIKNLRTIGLHHAIIRQIPLDSDFKMNANSLEQAVSADKLNGLKPFLIIATAGTTDTGSIDPLEHIASIASQHQVWLHIDAAYGGFFKLAPSAEKKLHAMALADSITLDPHKGLFLPYGIGAIVIKDASLQRDAFAATANYMQDIITQPDEWSPSDMSPELTKHFRALRMWMPLKYYGVAPFRHALEEKILLTQYFHEELLAVPDVDIACHPELSIVAFRFTPERGDINDFNSQLLKRINTDGRIFLSSTLLNGHYYIRMACLSFRTHLADITLALNIIKQHANEMIAC